MTKREYIQLRADICGIIDNKSRTGISTVTFFALMFIVGSASIETMGAILVIAAFAGFRAYRKNIFNTVKPEQLALKKLQECYDQGKSVYEFLELPECKCLFVLPREIDLELKDYEPETESS
jgi:hypothetical protein